MQIGEVAQQGGAGVVHRAGLHPDLRRLGLDLGGGPWPRSPPR
ncbi:hypothetical protein [Actinoplanes sp. NBRC 101535]|nr:hypothetical protein [Actinoplanes sp. NBRC 101535]